MEAETQKLDQRLQCCPEAATVRGVLFNWVVVEAGARFGAQVSKRVLRQLSPPGWGTLRTYPASEFLRLLYTVAEANVPHGIEPDETWRALGAGCANSVLASTLGRSMLALFGQIGPAAFLPQVPPAYRLFAGYGTRSIELLGPGEGVVRFRAELVPAAFHVGVFEAGLRAVQLAAEVEITPRSNLDFDLHARWG
jgi:uncharacterized protein (TIGR02265 family)